MEGKWIFESEQIYFFFLNINGGITILARYKGNKDYEKTRNKKIENLIISF